MGLGYHAARIYNLAASTVRRTPCYYRHTHTQLHISFPEIAYAYLHVHGVHVTTKLHIYIHTSSDTPGEYLWLPAAIPSFRPTCETLAAIYSRITSRYHKESVSSTDLSTVSFILEIRVRSFSREIRLELYFLLQLNLSHLRAHNYLVHSNDIGIIIITHDNTYIFTHTYS